MKIKSVVPNNTCCDLRDSWNILSKLSNDFGIVVHGPSGCMNESCFLGNKSLSFSTNLNESDITLGTGYEKLLNLVTNIISNYKQIKIIFVLGTCSSELIGEDIDNVASSVISNKVKIVAFHTSGMRGGGYQFSKYNVFSHFFNLFEDSSNLVENSINIFFQDGMQNDYFEKEIREFLSKFGIKVNCFVNSYISFEELKEIGKVKKNYLIGECEDFILILDEIYKKHNIAFSVLKFPIGISGTNKFFSSIYFDFFDNKKNYILKFIEYKSKILGNLDVDKLGNIFKNYNFLTNSKEYFNLLNYFGLHTELVDKELVKTDFVNFSHKFNSSNKILIFNKDNYNEDKIFSSLNFSTINKYMGLRGLCEFYNDLIKQHIYITFVNRYNNFL